MGFKSVMSGREIVVGPGGRMPTGRLAQLRYQVLVTLAVFFGLFLIEYPPLFSLGYWAWPYTVGYTVHKITTGLFILLNLGITQYTARRLGFFQRRSKGGGESRAAEPAVGTTAMAGEKETGRPEK